MKAITFKQLFQVVLIVLVFACVGYIFGIHMLFLHNAYEVFWYALYFIGSLTAYTLLARLVAMFSESIETVPAPTK